MAETGEHGIMMLAIHDALRRDLEHLQRVADAASAPAPARREAVLAGWAFFSSQLHHHHQSEDDDLWPRARTSLAGREAELALLDEMEAEHAEIDPAIAEVDEALRAQLVDADRLAAAVDRFRTSLVTHLRHEERDALPLLERTLDDRAWAQFSSQQARKGGLRGITEFMPWLLHGADDAARRRSHPGFRRRSASRSSASRCRDSLPDLVGDEADTRSSRRTAAVFSSVRGALGLRDLGCPCARWSAHNRR